MNGYKSEARNSKHETSTNFRTQKIRNETTAGFRHCRLLIWDLFRISDFEIRVHSIIALTLCASTCFAATLVTSAVDCGGQRTTSASYTSDGSVGGIGGVSTVVSPTEIIKAGYLGQLTEVVSLAVTSTPAQVSETGTSQLSGMALLDDDTLTALPGSDIAWSTPAWPIQGISASGVATAAVVYADTTGTISGQYLGVSGSGSLLVLDTIPDNYGSYAGDGLPDSWQNQYFGLDNTNAAPGRDVTGTGQNNLFKYVAGLDPTNATSRFLMRVEPVPGQPGQMRLVFSPRWSDRTYTPVFRTNLLGGTSWETLTGTNISDNGTERTVTDPEAAGASKFYRVQITYP